MRVISGIFKGKRLFSPEGRDVRPTADRIKETIFNILASQNAIYNAVVLDLFCGSGALGIEALSQGALQAVFIDKSPYSEALTKQNLVHVGFAPCDENTFKKILPDSTLNAELYGVDISFGLKRLKGRRFDLIFADPPYAAGLEQEIINLITQYNILSDDGVIVLEHSSKIDLQKIADGFIIDTRKTGNTSVSFIRRSN